MFKKSLIATAVTAATLIIVLLAAAFAVSTNFAGATLKSSQGPVDISARQPAPEAPLAPEEVNDWFQRHPESLQPANAVDTTDYYLRHLNSNVVTTDGASDWFQRHPESLQPANAVDTSDYVLRHPELMNAGKPLDNSDYWLRHPFTRR